MKKIVLSSACLFFVALLAGCGGEPVPELAEVNGTVTMDGQAMRQVMVIFAPDPEKGGTGQPARATTDEKSCTPGIEFQEAVALPLIC